MAASTEAAARRKANTGNRLRDIKKDAPANDPNAPKIINLEGDFGVSQDEVLNEALQEAAVTKLRLQKAYLEVHKRDQTITELRAALAKYEPATPKEVPPAQESVDGS